MQTSGNSSIEHGGRLISYMYFIYFRKHVDSYNKYFLIPNCKIEDRFDLAPYLYRGMKWFEIFSCSLHVIFYGNFNESINASAVYKT